MTAGINRHIAPEINITVIDEMLSIDYERSETGNGMALYTVNAGDLNLVRLDFVIRAGTKMMPNPLVSSFTGRMLCEGSKSLSGKEIADKLDFYGSFLDATADRDKTVVSLYSMKKYLPETLTILKEVLGSPVFPAEQFEIERRKQKNEYLVGIEKVSYIARLKFSEMVFGESHPYGRRILTKDFEDLSEIQLIEFYRDFYKRNDCYIVASGAIDDKSIDLIHELFGEKDFLASGINGFPAMPEVLQIKGRHYVEKKGAIQSALRIGRPLFNRTHPDFADFQVLNLILGGYFGSRLMKNIREDKGFTYGIGSSLIPYTDGGIFTIAAEVGTDVTHDALDEIYHEIRQLREVKTGNEELELVKSFLNGTLLRSFDGPFSKADRLSGIIDAGLDNEYYLHFHNSIQQVTSERLLSLAQQYFSEEDLTDLVVGNENLNKTRTTI